MRSKNVLWCKTAVEIPGLPGHRYNTELGFQVFCADWLRKRFEVTKKDHWRRWHHSANERSGARQGFLAKMSGQGKGWPDFVNPGLFTAIELKMPNGVLGDRQCDWLAYFGSIGWYSETVFTFERFKKIVLTRVELYEAGLLKLWDPT